MCGESRKHGSEGGSRKSAKRQLACCLPYNGANHKACGGAVRWLRRSAAVPRPTPSLPTMKRKSPTVRPPPSATTASAACALQSSAAATSATSTATTSAAHPSPRAAQPRPPAARTTPTAPCAAATGDPQTDRAITGHKSDTTGLLYHNARCDSPPLAPFISPDSPVPDAGIVIDYNRFPYTRAQPLIPIPYPPSPIPYPLTPIPHPPSPIPHPLPPNPYPLIPTP